MFTSFDNTHLELDLQTKSISFRMRFLNLLLSFEKQSHEASINHLSDQPSGSRIGRSDLPQVTRFKLSSDSLRSSMVKFLELSGSVGSLPRQIWQLDMFCNWWSNEWGLVLIKGID